MRELHRRASGYVRHPTGVKPPSRAGAARCLTGSRKSDINAGDVPPARRPDRVKAVRFHEFGGVDVLRVDEVDEPRPGPGEVLVRIRASALNHLDVDVREGISRFPVNLPHTLGIEVAGDVEEVGEGVEGWQHGDRVNPYIMDTCGDCRYCRTGRENALPDARLHQLLDRRRLRRGRRRQGAEPDPHPGQRVVRGRRRPPGRVRHGMAHAVHARSPRRRRDGDGQRGRQRHRLGRRPAREDRRRLRDRQRVERREARRVRASSAWTRASTTQSEDVVARVMELTDERGVDLVYEHVGGELFQKGLESLTKDGRLVICGGHSGEVVPFDIIPFFRGQHSVIGSFTYTREEVAKCLRARLPRAHPAARPQDVPARGRARSDGHDGAARTLRQARPRSVKEAHEARWSRRRRHLHRPDLRGRRGRRDPRPQASDHACRSVTGDGSGHPGGDERRPARARRRSTRSSTGRRSRPTSSSSTTARRSG